MEHGLELIIPRLEIIGNLIFPTSSYPGNIGKLIFSIFSYPGNIGNRIFPISSYPGNIGNLNFLIFYYPGNICAKDQRRDLFASADESSSHSSGLPRIPSQALDC